MRYAFASKHISLHGAVALALTSVLSCGFATSADAEDTTRCIRAMNNGARRVFSVASRAQVACIRDAVFTGGSADACLDAPIDAILSNAEDWLRLNERSFCSPEPSFGYSGLPIIVASARALFKATIEAVLGQPVDPSIQANGADKVTGRCQNAVIRAHRRLEIRRFRSFSRCKSAGLRTGAITADDDLLECLDSLEDTPAVERSELNLANIVASKCRSQVAPPEQLFPGACSHASDWNDFADCIVEWAACDNCQLISSVDQLGLACDGTDNGLESAACGHCGNGEVEAPELCDEAGNTAACDEDCTLPACGDDIVNTAAGETCDDGGSESCDPDCTAAECGDGYLNKESGEICDDGNNLAGDGCDEHCLCGDSPDFLEECLTPRCPDVYELEFVPTVGNPCTDDTECIAGACDPKIGRCRSDTIRSIGWTGVSHQDHPGSEFRLDLALDCGTAPPSGNVGGCGECNIVGLASPEEHCRCADDNRVTCNEPFGNDFDDCGGGACQCYLMPPQSSMSGNTPRCMVSKLEAHPSGYANVDTGKISLEISTRELRHLGEGLVVPCPFCEGDDATLGDGIRNGICVLGPNDGQACDATAIDSTFQAPGGSAVSFDCMPAPAKNVSGLGQPVTERFVTGTDTLGSNIECGFPDFGVFLECHCGSCSGDPSRGCASDTECEIANAGACTAFESDVEPMPNRCNNEELTCTDTDGPTGECVGATPQMFCDGILRASGDGLIECTLDGDCIPVIIDQDTGRCTIDGGTPSCFPPTIEVSGHADVRRPVLASVTCVGPTSSPGINNVIGLPGPRATRLAAAGRLLCLSNPPVEYTPGSGGCP